MLPWAGSFTYIALRLIRYRDSQEIIYMYFNQKHTWEGGGIRLVIIGLLERHKFKASQGPYWSLKQDTSPLLLNTLGFLFCRYLTRELIWHFSLSSIRPSIYFSSIVKSRSDPSWNQPVLSNKGKGKHSGIFCFCY